MFLKDTCRMFTDVPVYTEQYGGVLPLYVDYSGKNYAWWCIPAL